MIKGNKNVISKNPYLRIIVLIPLLLVFINGAPLGLAYENYDVAWTSTSSNIDNDFYLSIKEYSYGYILVGTRISENNSIGVGYNVGFQGDFLRDRTFEGLGNTIFHDIAFDDDGNGVVVGCTQDVDEDFAQTYVVKTDSSGYVMWERYLGAESHDVAYSVTVSDENYMVVGASKQIDQYKASWWLIDKAGSMIINLTYTELNNSMCKKVINAPDDGYIVAGILNAKDANGQDVFLSKVSENGEIEWTKVFESVHDDYFGNIIYVDNSYRMLTHNEEEDLFTTRFWSINTTGGDTYKNLDFFNGTSVGLHALDDSNYLLVGYDEKCGNITSQWMVFSEEGSLLKREELYEKQIYGISTVRTSDDGFLVIGYVRDAELFLPILIKIEKALDSSITFSIIDNNHTQIPYAKVYSIRTPNSQEKLNQTTDCQGYTFFKELVPGDYRFNITKEGYDSKLVSINLIAGDLSLSENVIDKILVPEINQTVIESKTIKNISLELLLVDENGEPLSNVTVYSSVEPNSQPVLKEFTDENGVILFPNLLTGNYTIRFFIEGYSDSAIDLYLNSSDTLKIALSAITEDNEPNKRLYDVPLQEYYIVIFFIVIIGVYLAINYKK
jgi:hypothetical protein